MAGRLPEFVVDAAARDIEDEADVRPDLRDLRVGPDLEVLQEPAGHVVDLDDVGGRAVEEEDLAAVAGGGAVFLARDLQALVVHGAIAGLRFLAAGPEVVDVELALGVALQAQKRVELLGLHDRLDLGEELPVFVGEIFYSLL